MRPLGAWRSFEQNTAHDYPRQGFVPYPTALLGGLTPEQIARQQEIYRRAYAQARAAVGYRKFTATFGREARN